MCLIIDKPAGVALKMEWIDSAVKSNRDGWGIMFHCGNVRVEKGLEVEKLKQWVTALKDYHAVFHLRLGTSGTKDVNNCHPFSVGKGIWMMHNGVIGIPSVRPDWSDTKHFAEFCVKPMLESHHGLYGSDMFSGMMSYFIGHGNKLVFMGNGGETYIVNKDEGSIIDGCWLSNLNYVNEGKKKWSDLSNEKWHVYTAGGWEDHDMGTQASEKDSPSRLCDGCPFTRPTYQTCLHCGLDKTEPAELQDVVNLPLWELTEFIAENPEDVAWMLKYELG